MVDDSLGPCPLCAAPANRLFATVEDYYFGSPGQWSILQCSNPVCGVAWPDPVPSDSVLMNAYSTYYTHSSGGDSRLKDAVKTLVTKLSARIPDPILRASDMTGSMRLVEDAFCNIGGMKPQKSGIILDVGTGNGDRLDLLVKAGWGQAIGVEIDPQAVSLAQSEGRDVRVGTADNIPLADGSVHAAILHHVIEHVRDPALALREAARVLHGNGGQVALLTPNFSSAARKTWGQYWRGLEAPRHLHIFTLPSLVTLVEQNGFTVEFARTSARSRAWTNSVSGAMAQKMGGASVAQANVAPEAHDGEEIIIVARRVR